MDVRICVIGDFKRREFQQILRWLCDCAQRHSVIRFPSIAEAFNSADFSGEVPDITADLRREIYTKVRMPQPAAADASDVMGAMRAAMAGPAGEADNGPSQ